MIFFGDENIPPRACRMLNAFDENHEIIPLSDEFPNGMADTDWLNALASRGEGDGRVAVLTRDAAILRRPSEAAALQTSGCHLIVLTPRFRKLKRDALLLAMVNNWRALTNQVIRLRHSSLIRWDCRGHKRVEVERRLSK